MGAEGFAIGAGAVAVLTLMYACFVAFNQTKPTEVAIFTTFGALSLTLAFAAGMRVSSSSELVRVMNGLKTDLELARSVPPLWMTALNGPPAMHGLTPDIVRIGSSAPLAVDQDAILYTLRQQQISLQAYSMMIDHIQQNFPKKTKPESQQTLNNLQKIRDKIVSANEEIISTLKMFK